MTLGMILYTMAALGFKVSIKKGERAKQVTWIGVRFTLLEDAVVLTLPEKFINELVETLRSWEGKGMVATKDLRKVAGRLAIAGILPRARWTVSTFYAVLHTRQTDVKTGAEASRRESRKDPRPKDHLFPVKQLDQARQWLITYLNTAMERPKKRYHLEVGKYPKATLLTDASPEGLGAILLINNQAIRAMASPVTQQDADTLKFTHGDSTGQGILEALAILVAIKLWRNELGSCRVELQIQSDSMIALALSQKMANSSASLNFIGAEMAIVCEAAAIERLLPTHVPGVANQGPDYLSRPSVWNQEGKPSALKGLKVQTPPERGVDYYSLPTPNTAPTMCICGKYPWFLPFQLLFLSSCNCGPVKLYSNTLHDRLRLKNGGASAFQFRTRAFDPNPGHAAMDWDAADHFTRKRGRENALGEICVQDPTPTPVLDPVTNDTPTPPSSRPSSHDETILSRSPREPINLATFITRREHVWKRHQLAGREVYLVLDWSTPWRARRNFHNLFSR